MAIELKGISKSFAGTPVLENISFTVPDTGVFGIFGPSGSGKTTLLRIITGLEKADAGEINGNTGLKFSYVFQEDRLLPSCTVLKNIAVVSDENEALKQLRAVHLEDAADKYPYELSGGMSRRAALARAFAYGGDVLILDEPFKGLEAELRDEIAALVEDFARTKPVILVTHDEGEKQLACGYYELRAEQ